MGELVPKSVERLRADEIGKLVKIQIFRYANTKDTELREDSLEVYVGVLESFYYNAAWMRFAFRGGAASPTITLKDHYIEYYVYDGSDPNGKVQSFIKKDKKP